MASPTRTRTRKTAQINAKAKTDSTLDEYSPEELELAAAQENQALQASQLHYLQQRVGQLRIELNRANKKIETLESSKN